MRNQEVNQIIQKQLPNINGLIVQHKGKIIYEHYFNYTNKNTYTHITSVTKSIVSILIGIALDEGKIASIDQPVLDFFQIIKLNSVRIRFKK